MTDRNKESKQKRKQKHPTPLFVMSIQVNIAESWRMHWRPRKTSYSPKRGEVEGIKNMLVMFDCMDTGALHRRSNYWFQGIQGWG